MTSKLISINPVSGNGIEVTIEHSVFDSYSRSVRPLATRNLKTSEAIIALKQSGWPGRGPIWQDRWRFDEPGADESKNLTRTVIPYVWVKPDWAE